MTLMIHREKREKSKENKKASRRRTAHRALTAMLSLVLVLSLIAQAAAATAARASGAKGTALELYDESPYTTAAFESAAMLPGDGTAADANKEKLTKAYCIKVSHSGEVKLRFKLSVKESSVLKDSLSMKAEYSVAEGTQTPLADGTFADLDGKEYVIDLPSSAGGSTEVVFTLNPYLPQTAGNECAGKTLKADFEWYVKSEGTGSSGSSVKPTEPENPNAPAEPTDPNAPSDSSDSDKSNADGKQDKDKHNARTDTADKNAQAQDGRLTPKTGDSLSLSLWIVSAVSAMLLLVNFALRRREEARDER